MKKIEYTLPEFVFFDGNSPKGDTLEGRTVLMHVRTGTVLEVIALDDVSDYEFKTETYEFTYKNSFGITENHMFAIHFSLKEYEFQEVFEKFEKWYCDYLTWEDTNIHQEYINKQKRIQN